LIGFPISESNLAYKKVISNFSFFLQELLLTRVSLFFQSMPFLYANPVIQKKFRGKKKRKTPSNNEELNKGTLGYRNMKQLNKVTLGYCKMKHGIE
jgi:hypothetical protein